MGWESFVGGGLTVGAVIFALSSWLGKVWANRILVEDKAKYKTQIDTLMQDLRTRDGKELFVHQMQFEKEFEVYKDLWDGVLLLGRAGRQFRVIQTGSPKPFDEARKNYAQAHKGLSDKVYFNRPFYSPEIFDLCKELLDAAATVGYSAGKQNTIEEKLSRYGDSDIPERVENKFFELDEEVEGNLDKINDLIGDVCDAIRLRIWSTDRTGWDRHSDNSKPS